MLRLSNFIIRTSIYLLVFLTPLFFLPFTFEGFEFNKQYLLFILAATAFLAWLAKMILVKKHFVFKRTPLDLPILALTLVMILSAVFSKDGISSWLGFYGRFSDAVVGFLAILIMYFVIVNNVGRKSSWLSIKRILNWFLVSSFLVIIAAYFSIFGIWSKIPWLGERLLGLMSLKSFNPMSGSLEGLAIFLAAVVSLVAGLILNYSLSGASETSGVEGPMPSTRSPRFAGEAGFARSGNNKRSRLGNIFGLFRFFLLIASIILLLLIDFWAAWLALGLTMLFLLITAFLTQTFRERVNILLLPIILIVISAAGYFGVLIKAKEQIAFFRERPLPQEVILDYKTAALTTLETVKESPVLGSGPGTFLYGFSKFKPEGFNEHRFWNIRFDKAPSHLMELAAATGILGILSYLAVVIMFLLVMGMFLFRRSEADFSGAAPSFNWGLPPPELLPLLLVWLSLFVSQFVYLGNIVLIFSFWLFTALGIVIWRQNLGVSGSKTRLGRSQISFSFKKWPEIGLVISTIFLVLVFAVLGLFYLGGRFYLADVYYLKGLNQSDIDNKLPNFEKAVNLNKYRINYRISLSQAYLVMAWREVRKPEAERNIQLLQNYAAGAIDQARQVTEISPKLVMSWENLANIYRDLSALVSGVSSFSEDSFKEALTSEPTNPFFYRELCRLDLMSEKEISDNVLNNCQKAVDLKPNYLDAHIQLALVYERKGNLEDAVRRLEGALDKLKGISFERGSVLAGAATEIYFQMGRMHFNLRNFDRAVELFEQAVIVTPEHANARYGLGTAYQMKGRNQEALIQFQIVNQLVPGNAEVEAKINELSQG